jgi:hypothetical protein
MVENRGLGTEGVRKNNEQGLCPICDKEKSWSHILRCEGIKIWRDQVLDKRFRNRSRNKGTVGCKNK